MSTAKTDAEVSIVGWSGITATLTAAILQTTVFYVFFSVNRSREKKKNSHSLYEPRQHLFSHRSPAPFAKNWIMDAWRVDKDELRRNVGMDSYMFLRFLRLGTRISALGVLCSSILIPIYVTGEARGDDTVQFNQLTLGRVDQGSHRIWATAFLWWVFIGFILKEFWSEWNEYRENRREFLAKGDPDGNLDMRYALLVEKLPDSKKSDQALASHFEAIFPNQVRQATVFLEIEPLQEKIAERQTAFSTFEKATAFTKAKPEKPRPQMKIGGKLPCLGEKVDTIDHCTAEYERLNAEIDQMRITGPKDGQANDAANKIENNDLETNSEAAGFKPSSTGVVIFTSLRAKESAMAGHYEDIQVFSVADPKSILWENATVPYIKQRLTKTTAASLWIAGVLFWTVPVTFVTALANLDSILKTLGLKEIDSTSAAYGVISGLLPVIALAILMAVLYMAIVTVGQKFIRFKSAPEVDSYTLYWHMLFQIANLWLILIGGSLFSQFDKLQKDPNGIVDVIAKALPGASVFLANMVIAKGLGNFGLELSMLPTYGVTFVMSLLAPEAQRTQRMLDAAKTPPELKWGSTVPHSFFVFLVMILYMPIVPLMEVFALIYFGGTYVVWKHQCLHVYAQSSDSGGVTTWQALFGFLITSLYMGETVFIAYMGIKKAPGAAACGFVPLVVTAIFHVHVHRTIVDNIGNLALDVAADIDEKNGGLERLESSSADDGVYGQPALKTIDEEREPMPYRRDASADDEPDKAVDEAL